MSSIETLEALGFRRKKTLIEEVAAATGRPHGGDLVENTINTAMGGWRKAFISDGLVVRPTSWKEGGAQGVYDEFLVYFWAAYVEKFPPLPRSMGRKSPTAFEQVAFKEAFFAGDRSATRFVPKALRPAYQRMIKKRRKSAAPVLTLVPRTA